MWISWMLLSLRGRIRRRDWWVGGFVLALLQIAGLAVIYGRAGGEPSLEAGASPGVIGLTLLLLWPAVAMGVKREHDRDRSGWAVVLLMPAATLLGLLPEILPDMPDIAWLACMVPAAAMSLYLLVTLGFVDGTPGPNRFGNSPKRFDVLEP